MWWIKSRLWVLVLIWYWLSLDLLGLLLFTLLFYCYGPCCFGPGRKLLNVVGNHVANHLLLSTLDQKHLTWTKCSYLLVENDCVLSLYHEHLGNKKWGVDILGAQLTFLEILCWWLRYITGIMLWNCAICAWIWIYLMCKTLCMILVFFRSYAWYWIVHIFQHLLWPSLHGCLQVCWICVCVYYVGVNLCVHMLVCAYVSVCIC